MRRLAGKMDFEDFWSYAKAREKGCNEVVYHGCCDSWTSRGSKKVRDSHVEHLRWRNLIRSLGDSEEDKKTLLRAQMVEKRWRMPVAMNEFCKLAVIDNRKRKAKKKVVDAETNSLLGGQETQRTFTLHPQSAFER